MTNESIMNEYYERKKNKMSRRDRYTQEERIYDCRSRIQEQSETSFKTQKPEVGEIWHIRIKNNVTLTTMKVKDLSERTVLLITTIDEACMKSGIRYEINDIEFIEKVK